MFVKRLQDKIIAIFYRNKILYLDNLIYYRTTSFSIEVVRIINNDKILDCFVFFVAKFVIQNINVDKTIRVE